MQSYPVEAKYLAVENHNMLIIFFSQLSIMN